MDLQQITDLLDKKFNEKFNEQEKKMTARFDELKASLSNVFNERIEEMERKHKVEIEVCHVKIKNSDDMIKQLKNELAKISARQDEHQDREMRSTLIFRDIPFDPKTENSWEDTKVKLSSEISNHCPSLRFDQIKNSIDRCHRNLNRNPPPNNKSVPSISVKFKTWKDSNDTLQRIIEQNKSKKNKHINVSQQYSEQTTKRRNEALKRRKELMKENQNKEFRLIYPAKLLARKKHSKEQFELVEEF